MKLKPYLWQLDPEVVEPLRVIANKNKTALQKLVEKILKEYQNK